MADHGGSGRRCQLVLIASPLQGHMTPMLQLGTYLHSKGCFSITIAHSEFNSPDPSKHPDFHFQPLPDNVSGTDIVCASFIHFVQTYNNNCKPHFQGHLIKIINEQKDKSNKESIVIIHDHLMFFAASVASELGLPNIILRSSSAAFYPAFMIIPKLHQQGRYPAQDSSLQDIVPELHPFRYMDLPYNNRPVEETLRKITMSTPNSPPSASIYNTLEFLEESALTEIRDHYQGPIFTIGPLHKIIPTPSTSFLEEDMSCISWLNKQAPKSVVYVSLGSLAHVDEKVSTEMAWGLANSNQQFLWVIRPGSVHGFEWIEFLPEGLVAKFKKRGLIVKWAPQKEVLAHNAVGGFWSHCGWNSTLEGVCEGVPMLCQPFVADQQLNARYLSYVWKMGIEIVVERGEIKGAIKRLLVDEEGKKMRGKAMEIQEKIKIALSHGGSSQNSLIDLVDFILSM
uniref:UDP-glycosyltransferase 76H1-like n=1 Tax=Erigeron canadensis TaxID=72917 RepID=UPI001CB97F48|nr:UDP-glycosyltransferase 76H1-like [Erigeron canadensis]